MGLLDKLTTAGSTLTDLDGKTPTKYDGVSNYKKDLATSQLDLDGVIPPVSSANPGQALPYLNNLPG